MTSAPNPSQNAVTGSSGTHPVPEGAADNAPPAIRECGVQTDDKEIGKQIGTYLGMSGIDAQDVSFIRALVLSSAQSHPDFPCKPGKCIYPKFTFLLPSTNQGGAVDVKA